MTNPDWTDRTLPVTVRVVAAREYARDKELTYTDRDELVLLLQDCEVVIREMDDTHGFGETLSRVAMEHATGPKGEPWFPRD